MKKKEWSYLIIIVFILLLFCISNCINIFGLTQPKLFGIIIFLILFILFITKKIRKHDGFNLIKAMSIGFCLLGFFSAISVFVNKKMEMTNIFEIIRPFLYMASLIIFDYIFNRKDKINFFNKVLYGVIIVFFIIDIIQFHNFGNINELYIKTIAPTQYVTLINGYAYPRVVGLMSNPNAYGYILALFSIYLVYLLFKKKHFSGKLLFLLIINRVNMYLTGSRTAFLACIIGELIFVFLWYLTDATTKEKGKKIFKSFFACFLVLIVELGIMFSLPNRYSWRIKSIFDKTIESWEKRKDTTNKVLDEFMSEPNEIVKEDKVIEENPKEDVEKNTITEEKKEEKDNDIVNNDVADDVVEDNVNSEEPVVEKSHNNSTLLNFFVGKGPIKNGFAFDNEWVHIFVTLGSLGLISFIVIYVLGGISLIKCNTLFRILYISIVIFNAIYMIAAGSYFSYNLFIAFLMFIVLGYRGEKNEE